MIGLYGFSMEFFADDKQDAIALVDEIKDVLYQSNISTRYVSWELIDNIPEEEIDNY